MASRTYNRRPVQVDLPSSRDVKDYFFNHSNWKGVNENKNFLAVDQETFADAKNVYVNGEGVLRSRPAIKKYSKFNETIDDIHVLGEIVAIRKPYEVGFSEVVFYRKNGDSTGCSLVILEQDAVNFALVDNKIFIFAPDGMWYLDKIESDSEERYFINEIKDFVYVPRTVFDASGVKKDVEDKNILTDSEIYVYLYNSEIGVSPEVYGKTVSIEIEGKRYETVFSNETRNVIADVRFKLTNDTFTPLNDIVIVSNNNSYAVFSKNARTISYSPSGQNITAVYELPETMGNIISKPQFSTNGLYLIVATDVSIYILSVLSEDFDNESSGLRFPEFTDLYDVVELEGLSLHRWFAEKSIFEFHDWNDFVVVQLWYDSTGDIINVLKYDTENGPNEFSMGPQATGLELDDFSKTHLLSVSYNNDTLLKGQTTPGVICLCYTDERADRYGSVWRSAFDVMDGDMQRITSTVIPDYSNVEYADIHVGLERLTLAVSGRPLGTGNSGARCVIFDGETAISTRPDEYSGSAVFISSDGNKVLTENLVYNLSTKTKIDLMIRMDKVWPVGFTNYVHYMSVDDWDQEIYSVYSSRMSGTYELIYKKEGEIKHFGPTLIKQLDAFYAAMNRTLYISEYRENENGEFLWYFPESNKHTFDSNVTGLQPISTSEMGVFLDNEVWYVGKSEAGYTATKSRFDMGLKTGSDVISSDDGVYTFFCTKRGFAALQYQDFVASTDQTLVFLSDPIYNSIVEYTKRPVKLFKWSFWIILYHQKSGDGFVFDTRNSSWWPVSYTKNISKIFVLDDDVVLLCDKELYYLYKNHDSYFDVGREVIDWYVTSQKLHLNAANYYKHIVNMTLSSIIDVYNENEPLTYNLEISNYRERVDRSDAKTLGYKVDVIRTFIQRLNHFKVNEFQYTLRTDNENKVQLPLSLSDITIKYKITGQVR